MKKSLSRIVLVVSVVAIGSMFAFPVWGAPPVRPVTSVTASSPLTSSGGITPDISLTGVVPVVNGGTGATTADGARSNLGAAASGANSDITSLLGLTTPLSVTQGGTGTTTGLAGYQKKIGGVAIVAQSGGDYTDPATAMSDYAAWCGTPSATNPCLLKIMPGVYTVTSPVVMRPYIDIEGSGETVTKITGAFNTETLVGASNAELRFLTVENTGTGTQTAIAILNYYASPSMIHVTAAASGGTNNRGVYNYSSSATMTDVTATASGGTNNSGVFNSSSSPTMTDVTATASGGTGNNTGVDNYDSSPTMTNVTATASGETGINTGVNNYAGTVKINHSVIKGTNYSIYNFNYTTYIGDSQLDGSSINLYGALTCVGAYNGSYVALSNTCQ